MESRKFEQPAGDIQEEAPDRISRRDFLKKAAVGALGINSILTEACKPESRQVDSPESKIKRGFLQEVRPQHNMPSGFGRYEVHAENNSGKEELVGSFFTIEAPSGESHVEFLSKKLHPQFFTPGLNFEAVAEYFRNNHKQIVLQAAGAFTPDYKQIQGLAYENGLSVGQDRPSEHNGLLVIKNGRPEIIFLDEIGNLDTLLQEAKNNKWSFFQQIPAIRHGAVSFQTKNNSLYETRFFVERKTPAGITSGIVNFSKRMTISEAIEVLGKMDSGTSRIENALYLDVGAVSEGYFYTKDGKSYKMTDEQFNPNPQEQDNNRKKYTNLVVLSGDIK